MGENPNKADTISRIAYENLDYNSEIPQEIASEIIEQRPDYIKAEQMIEKAGIDVRVAKKEFLPSINLTGIALFLSSEIGSLLTTRTALAALAGAINMPLFTGGKRRANLKLKKDEYERVLNNYYQTNLTAIQEVNDALTIIKHDDKKYQDTKAQAQLERRDYGFNEASYNQGVLSKLDLIQMKENVLSTDKLVADQKINCLVDYIGLYKAVGSQL
jgi:outer membrane protein TolC